MKSDLSVELTKALQEQTTSLLDAHIENLSTRVFEAGRKADQQFTAWMTFAALTILLCFGAAESVSLAGLQLEAAVAFSVTYVLACAFYYRATMGITALRIWRNSLRERRRLRFGVLLEVARQHGPVVEEDTVRNLGGFVPEYPGFVASSVLVKDAALKRSGPFAAYVVWVHKAIIVTFAASPYLLAACILYRTWFSWPHLLVACVGIMMTLSANVMIWLELEG